MNRGSSRGAAHHGRSVLFLTPGIHGPSSRFRILQYLPHLRARGVAADVADLAAPFAARWRLLASAGRYDSVVVHRAFLAPHEWFLLRRAASGYVFDFDDAIVYRDSAARRLESRQRRARFARMVKGARRVVAGNDYLAGLARAYNPSTVVIPTSVDVAPYDTAAPSSFERATVVWIGTRVNLMYLEPVLAAVARAVRSAGAELEVICDDFPRVDGIDIVRRRWSLADEARDLMRCDVGIMPLPDDAWTRGKCALKILQYFAASLPVVCSPVGANTSVVEHGRSGYFARNGDEWAGFLEELLRDSEKRRRFGRAGRETVERSYSVEANLERLIAAIL